MVASFTNPKRRRARATHLSFLTPEKLRSFSVFVHFPLLLCFILERMKMRIIKRRNNN